MARAVFAEVHLLPLGNARINLSHTTIRQNLRGKRSAFMLDA